MGESPWEVPNPLTRTRFSGMPDSTVDPTATTLQPSRLMPSEKLAEVILDLATNRGELVANLGPYNIPPSPRLFVMPRLSS